VSKGVTIPYSHPDLADDVYFGSLVIQVPLGIEVLDYRREKMGEDVIFGPSFVIDRAVSNGTISKNLIVKDHRPEIAKVYGKPAAELTPPEGYEFTGEFRLAGYEECILFSGLTAVNWPFHGWTDKRYLILRPIETNHGKGQSEVKRGFTAAEVTQKFGKEVVTFFVRIEELYDLPGFVYTGELTHPKAGNWYLTEGGWVGKAASNLYSLHFILEKIETAPRIITYTLTDRADLEPGEAGYTPLEDGGMTLDNTNGPVVYTRSEVE
jgi:hypothetical protein